MKIIEVRDGFIKFESEKNIQLSSFLQISGDEKEYIAQVIQVKHAGEINIIYAKILFLYNGELLSYDKTLPSKNSETKEFPISKINESFNIVSPVNIGSFISDESSVVIDKNFFNKKLLASIDSPENCRTIIYNLANNFENSIIIDTLGVFDKNKYIAGSDFRLPLNTDSLEFMYEDCLNDATSDSKNLIKEIFQDLSNYSKTVPFVPFGALKTIVDDMVNKSHIFKLLVLKNKLAKFDKLGYFAATIEDAENLNQILSHKNVVIDLSKLDATFQNRYLDVIYSTISRKKGDVQLFVTGTNNLNKKILKKLITGDIATTFITHSRFKYINEIKGMFTNYIIEPSFVNNEVFKTYATFLSSMKKDTYLVVGEGTNYIPLVSLIKENYSTIQDTQTIIEIDTEESEIIPADKLEEALEAIDPATEAIDKKSEDFIEKVSEEIQNETPQQNFAIFQDDEDGEIDNENINEISDNTDTNDEITNEISDNSLIDDENNSEEITNDDIEEMSFTTENSEETTELTNAEDAASFMDSEAFHTQVDEFQTIEIPEEISEITEDVLIEEISTEEVEIEETIELDTEDTYTSLSEQSDDNLTQEPLAIPDVIQLDETSEFDDIEEIVELDETDFSDSDIIVELEDNDNIEVSEEVDRAIIEDVDKVFTTMKDDTITDSDLDFIDELNNDENTDNEDSLTNEPEIVLSEGMEELTEFIEEEETEENFLEPLIEVQDTEDLEDKEILETKKMTTPMVPVYDAQIPTEDMVVSDPIEQGDTVVHAKYGNGVVEKMIKYGTKTLFSINFDNIGRRLLDPTLTEIKKA